MMLRDYPNDERPRERLLKQGAASLSEAELLAICLRTGTAGASALDLARTLIREAGGLPMLLSAAPEELLRRRGLGLAKVCQLKAGLELARRALEAQLTSGAALSSPRASAEYLKARLAGHPYEVFAALFLDNRNRVLAFEELFRGTVDGAQVHPREVVRRALAHNAAAAIFAHNHPSGDADPSAADIAVTRRLADALALIDVRVLDHFVIGRAAPVSLAERGLL